MRKRAHRKNRLVSKQTTTPSYEGNQHIPTTVDLIQYDTKDCIVRSIDSNADLLKEIDTAKVNWFKVTGISNSDFVSKICRNFGLHGFDIKELLTDTQVVKIAPYENVTFCLISGYYQNTANELEDMQIAFILGKDFVVSFKEAPIPVFKEVEKCIIENIAGIRQKGPDFLLYLLLNAVNSLNNNLIANSESRLFEVEDELIMEKESTDILHFLHNQRVAHMHMKHYMSSLREEFSNLINNENNLVQEETMVYFENLDDRIRAAMSNLENYQESLMSLLDLYYNNNSKKMNEVMKRLTLVSTIFIPLTFMVGVWGMNFDIMPELKWKYGYLIAWGVFIVMIIVMWMLMKKRRWF